MPSGSLTGFLVLLVIRLVLTPWNLGMHHSEIDSLQYYFHLKTIQLDS